MAENNEKLARILKNLALIATALGVIGGGSFLANYWQDRQALQAATHSIEQHESRLQALETSLATLVQIEKMSADIRAEVKQEVIALRKDIQEIKISIAELRRQR